MANEGMTLAEFLQEHKKKPSAFAAELGVPPSTILRIISGEREARISTAAKIVAATDGAVGYADLQRPRPVEAPTHPEPTGAAAA